jgi:hypothetical protein
MAHESLVRNPFILMTNPEVVIAAIERSEHLGQLNRHLCRPLDRPVVSGNAATGALRDHPAGGDASVAVDPLDLADDGDDADLAD